MKTIYNKDGEVRKVDHVDAVELIDTGRWSYQPFPMQLDLTEETTEQAEELTYLDEFNEEVNPPVADATSPEAYAAREAAFQQAEAEKAAEAAAVEEEIKKAKHKGKK